MTMRIRRIAFVFSLIASIATAQQSKEPPPTTLRAPSRAELLRGEYGRYRANNDLLHYDLDVRIDPEKKWISGRNTVRFKMLKDDTRIQLELYANLAIDRITAPLKGVPYDLKYTREVNTVYIDFPETCDRRTYSTSIYYRHTTRGRRLMPLPSRKIPAPGATPTKASPELWDGTSKTMARRARGMTLGRGAESCQSRTGLLGRTTIGDGKTKGTTRPLSD